MARNEERLFPPDDMKEDDWERHVAKYFPRCPLCSSELLKIEIKYGRKCDYIDCYHCYAEWEIYWKGTEYEIEFIKLVEVKDIEKISLKGEKHEPDFWLEMSRSVQKG
jgi:uncharacterized protein with PIN domain